jgi:hypothetical protein
MANRAPGWEENLYDVAWYFIGGKDARGMQVPGIVRFTDQPTGGGNFWDSPVLGFDKYAQDYLMGREKRPGIPVQFSDGTQHEVSYKALDDDADVWLQQGCQPQPGTITILFRDGVRWEQAPRSFWEQLLAAHIQRRQNDPPVELTFQDGKKLTMSFLNLDAVCKDFMRRRADLLAVNWWPELLIQERVIDPSKPGPMPVEGRPNALGQGARVMTPAELAAPGVAPGPVPHPALDNNGIV